MPDLENFAPNVWLVEGPSVRMAGIRLPTRMIVLKLTDGSLWVNSPVAVSSDMLARITALGQVRYLVAPTKLHVWRLEEWHGLFPDAELWMPSQRPKAFMHWPAAGILGDVPPPIWTPDLDQLVFKGNYFIEEIHFLHKASRTAILGDFIQNHRPVRGRPFSNALFKLAGVAYPDGGVAFDIKLSFTNTKLARRSLEKLLSWDFDNLVLAHGASIKGDAKTFVKRAFQWLA